MLLALTLAQIAGTAQNRVVRTDFCEVLKNPEQYDEKEVVLRATWKYGFEWSYLYCVSCRDAGKVWLDFSDDIDDASRRVVEAAPKDAAIVNLTLAGLFKTGRGYGHMGGYPHKFIARKAWDVVVISRGMKSPEKEKEIEAKSACGGSNPK